MHSGHRRENGRILFGFCVDKRHLLVGDRRSLDSHACCACLDPDVSWIEEENADALFFHDWVGPAYKSALPCTLEASR